MRAFFLSLAAVILFSTVARADTLGEVRVHGNHTTPDAEVVAIAGLKIGQPLTDADIEAARRRLHDSGRFEDVEIRKRFRSMSETGDIALIVIVREHAVPDEALAPTPRPLRPFRRLFASGMFLPILHYEDGYGFTYGARFTFADTLGRGGRISVPLTWGGTKRVAVEADRVLNRGPIDRLTASASLWRRTNPFFEQDEDRREVTVGAGRRLARSVRIAAHAGWANVTFGTLEERLGSYGADVVLDTRHDPVFPRNAVYAAVGWTALSPSVSSSVNQYHAEVRGYRALVGQSVLSIRWQYLAADGRLPEYERYLLGGSGSVRGYRTGSFAGDNLMAGSIEVRIPVSSPMGISRAGFSLFTDVGSVWDHGATLGRSRFRRGVGGGVFLLASVFQLGLDVGVREGGGVRLHFNTGLQF